MVMNRYRPAAFVLAGLVALATPGAGSAQTAPGTPPPAYRPGLGDLMTMTVQQA
jgi:hypothetical protein